MERDTVSLADFRTGFTQAVQSYTHIFSGAASEIRETSASRFKIVASELKHYKNIEGLLLQEITSHDVYQRNTALRLLIEFRAVDILQRLPMASDKSIHFFSDNVRRLWAVILDTSELITRFDKGNAWQRIRALEALLSAPSDEATAFFKRLVDQREIIFPAVQFVSEWDNQNLLEYAFRSLQPDLSDIDPALEQLMDAVFLLALNGNADALEWLKSLISTNKPSLKIIYACERLAWLSQPEVVEILINLLEKQRESDLVMLSLEATKIAGTGNLGLALYRLLSHLSKDNASGNQVNDLISTLEFIFGRGEYLDEYRLDTTPPHRTTKNLELILNHFATFLAHTLPQRRYRNGQLLTLEQLTIDLSSPHDGQRQSAIYNLRAIVGETQNYDLRGDLIDNITSIMAWKKRIGGIKNFTSGSWHLSEE